MSNPECDCDTLRYLAGGVALAGSVLYYTTGTVAYLGGVLIGGYLQSRIGIIEDGETGPGSNGAGDPFLNPPGPLPVNDQAGGNIRFLLGP